MQRIVLFVEALDLVHVRRTDEAAVERVGPRVVRALDRLGQFARDIFAQAGAAMTADVEERVQFAAPVAHDDQ